LTTIALNFKGEILDRTAFLLQL